MLDTGLSENWHRIRRFSGILIRCLLTIFFSTLTIPVYAGVADTEGQEAISRLTDTLKGKATESCSVEAKIDGTLEVQCAINEFPLGKYCVNSLPLANYQAFISFYADFIQAVKTQLPGGRVFDYEVVITGVSDGKDFVRNSFDTTYQCKAEVDLGQADIARSVSDMDARLAIFRGMSLWQIMYREAMAHNFPLLFPNPKGGKLTDAPGRVILNHAKEGAVGGFWRRASVSIKITPKLFVRCQPGTHSALINGYETCLPDCQFGTRASAINGTVICLPECQDGEYLVLENGGHACRSHCSDCGQTGKAATAEGSKTHLAIGVSGMFLGGNHYYGERVMVELGVVSESVSWFIGLGAAFKNNDDSYGMAVSGTLKVNPWKKPAIYPRLGVSFQNFRGGDTSFLPFWIIAAEPGLEWEFYRFNHGVLSLLLLAQLGVRIADTDFMDGAMVRTRTDSSFSASGGIGLGFYFW